MAWYEIINAKSDSYIADRDAEDMLRQLGTALHRACRVTEVGNIGQRFQPKEHQVLVLG